MSKRAYISRYLLILKKLRTKPYSSFEELESYMEKQFEYLQESDEGLEFAFSKRTFQRDIKEINNLFGIAIEFSKKEKGYYIAQSERENMNFQRMMEAFDLFNSLNIAADLAPFIHVEKRKPQGTENLYGLLHAIKNKLQIKFEHENFYEETITAKITEPYALKEFKDRWYLIAKDLNGGRVKTFGLDRITELEITTNRFTLSADFNLEEMFRYCYGIFTPRDKEPEEIILSFIPEQGKYTKSLPLHESQQILIDNEDELRVQLKLFITHDFVMELLSFGADMKVLQPESLVDLVKKRHEEAAGQYGLSPDPFPKERGGIQNT